MRATTRGTHLNVLQTQKIIYEHLSSLNLFVAIENEIVFGLDTIVPNFHIRNYNRKLFQTIKCLIRKNCTVINTQ